MNIFIPEHLKKIPIINQLYNLLVEYSTAVDENGDYLYYQPRPAGSFDNYNYYMNSDPVKRFIMLDLELEDKDGNTQKEVLEKNGMDYTTVVNYLTTLFYSVKGTKKVIEFALKYFHLSEFTYNIKGCSLKVNDDVRFKDSTDYISAAKDFCEALLYFNEFRLDSGFVTLELSASGESYVQAPEYGESNKETYEEIIITE